MGPVAGWLSLVVAVLAFVLAWRADRRTRVLSAPWSIVHFQRAAFIVENRTTRTLHDVEFGFPPGTSLSRVEGDLATAKPAGKVKILVFRSLGGGDLFEISWCVRRRSGRRRSTMLVLPAHD